MAAEAKGKKKMGKENADVHVAM